MKKLLLLLAPLAGCAAMNAPPGPPIGHPTLCGECTYPCPNTERVCNKTEAVAAAPAQVAAPAPRQAAAAVTFEPAPGNYATGQMVTLSTTTPNAVIHYTTDGSTPTEQSPVYTGPFRVDSGTTVKAIAIAPGMSASEVSSGTYAVAPPPPPPPSRVTVSKGKLELKEKIFFDTGKATIKPESYSILDETAAVMKDHPEVKKVRIEGHTDSKGSPALNKKLSAARAASVRSYLVDKGVDAKRLDSAGFGAARPIADNKTAAGREKNRRVDFMIEQ